MPTRQNRSQPTVQVLRSARGRTLHSGEQSTRRQVIQPTFDEGLTEDQVKPRMRLFKARVRPMAMTVPSPQ
jgi:hypothetical protein